MAPRYLLSLTFLLALTACDSDDDGLSNSEEEALGTNPDVADTDGDGLLDGVEVERGTDPLSEDSDSDGVSDGDEVSAGLDPLSDDSDNDGYPDGAEIEAGSDPLDETSWIYEGGWPYNGGKDSMEDPGFSSGNGVGKVMPRLVAFDQFGDEVDLYDFAMQGKPIIVDKSASWCGYCKELAKWLERKDNYYDQVQNFNTNYEPIRAAVETGDLIWITVLDQKNDYSAPTKNTVKAWYNKYPHEAIPVLADIDQELSGWWKKQSWPSFMLLDENMVIVNKENLGTVFDATLEAL